MLTLSNPHDNRRVVDAIKHASDPRNTGDGGLPVTLSLMLDGKDIFERVEEAEWGQSETPITLDATVAGSLPRRLIDARVRLHAEIDGVKVPCLYGEKTALLPSDSPYKTDLISSSAGALLGGEDAVKLDEDTEYPGMPPHQIAQDVARRLPYKQSLVQIQRIPRVTLNYQGTGDSPGFLAHEATGDVLSRLAEDQSVGYLYRDRANGGTRAYVPRPLARTRADKSPAKLLTALRTYDAAYLPSWHAQRPQPPLERYSHVRVYRLDPASGKLLWEVTREVPYPPDVRRPHRHRTKHIPFEDASDAGPDNGTSRCLQEAMNLARGVCSGDELTLPTFDPLIEAHDDLLVTETHSDDDGLFEIAWTLRAETYTHLYSASSSSGSLLTEISYTAAVLEESRIHAPTIILPLPSSGIILNPRDPYGVLEGDIYFDEPLSWVDAQGDDLVFYDNSNGAITISGDDAVVSK